MRIVTIFKAQGLLHINFIFKIFLEEGIVDDKLTQWPTTSYGNAKNKTNGCMLDDMAESIREIDARCLMKSFRHQSWFIALNRTIC